MCKVAIVFFAIIFIAASCLGQSVFMDYGKSCGSLTAIGGYNINSRPPALNTGTISLGGSYSFRGRADLNFSFTHFIGTHTLFRDQFGNKLITNVPSETFGFDTEVFIYKSHGPVPFMLSVDAGTAIGDNIGIEGSPLILSVKTSKNPDSFIVLSLALSYYDADIEAEHPDDHGTASVGQLFVFARRSDNIAIAIGPYYSVAKYSKSFSVAFALLFF